MFESNHEREEKKRGKKVVNKESETDEENFSEETEEEQSTEETAETELDQLLADEGIRGELREMILEYSNECTDSVFNETWIKEVMNKFTENGYEIFSELKKESTEEEASINNMH